MGASESCCNSPLSAVNREFQHNNGQTYAPAPQFGNQYNDIEQQLLMERQKIKTLMQNEKIYNDKFKKLAQQNKVLKQKVNTLSKNAKVNKTQLQQKTAEIEKLLNDKDELTKSSEEYKVKNDELTEKLTENEIELIEKVHELKKKENPKQFRQMPQDVNYQDYDVTFNTATSKGIGLKLCSLKDGKSCLVRKCLTKFTYQNVNVGSIICEINGTNVMGLQYEIIRDMLIQHAATQSVTITFRSKSNGAPYTQVNNVNERGKLHLKVVGCMQLKHTANYVEVCIGNTSVRTKEIKSNEHPEWMELMEFKNFRCDYGKKAMITVYGKSAILKDKKIGGVEYELPVQFNKLQNESLELKNNKGNLSGVIVLEAQVLAPTV